MSPMKLNALNQAARDDLPTIHAVAYGDDGKPVFCGRIEYADGGYFGIVDAASGEVREWPMELVQIEGGER